MQKILVVTLLMLLVLGVFAGTGLAQTSGEKITDMVVEGNQRVVSKEILNAVSSEVGQQIDRDQLKKDLQAIYDLGYFQDVRISFSHYEDGLRVEFEVEENPVLKEIKIEGKPGISRDKILDWLGVKQDKILNVNQLNEGLKNVRQQYQDQGYVLAKYNDVNISEKGVLTLDIDVGHINEIIIEGNEKTQNFVVERNLTIEEGQVLNTNDIRETYQKLYRLNYFEEINPELQRLEEGENEANVVINLNEKKTGNLNFGGGYSSRDGWLGFISVQEKNLFGRAQNLGFEWQFGENNHYTLNFKEPWLFGSNTSFGISLYDRTTTDSDDKEETRTGGNLTFGHPLTDTWDGSIRYRLEDIEYETEKDFTDLRSLRLATDRDTYNHPFHPTTGAIDNLSIEYAGDFLGGDYEFTKYEVDLRRFYPGFKKDQAWALRLNLGISDSKALADDFTMFNLGGSNTLRGYEKGDLDLEDANNDNRLFGNIEYRFPFADNFTGVVFADGGNVWEDTGDISLNDLHYAGGLGVRMNTPVGQLRLDYGWNEDGEGKAHFSIGNTF
ncbi:MAG: BamA/OMP85 family outer membrane protein [Bacillota bacterium]